MFKDIVRGNEIIEEKIHNAVIKQTRLAHLEVLSAIQEQMQYNKFFIVPSVNGVESEDLFLFRSVSFNEHDWIPVFTTWEEFSKGPKRKILYLSIKELLKMILTMDDVDGIVINPMGESGFIEKSDLEAILKL